MREKTQIAKKMMISVFLLLSVLALVLFLRGYRDQEIEDKVELTIAVPYDVEYADFDESYYVEWLEEETGYEIEIQYISETYTTEYLSMIFTSASSDVDAIFFTNDNEPSSEELEYYIANGYLLPLEGYIDSGEYLAEIIEEFLDYDLEKTLQYEDGHIYYMPALTMSETQCYLQTAWMNVEWLEELGLEMPSTTEELKVVLQAFKEMDENAVPLIGSAESENTFVCNFLINSFTTCDPFNYYFALDAEGELYYPPITEEWREGLEYCNELYEAGLLVEENFTYSVDELISICNDSDDVVGMFLAKGLSDIIYDTSPQLLSYFLVLSPLNDTGTVTLEAQLPKVGGVILNTSDNIEETFQLLDLMCGEEAYVISHFGEYEEDWTYSSSSDVSVLGYPAVITRVGDSNLERTPSESTILGPFITDLYYADRVSWVGYQVNQSEYMQARAYRTYQSYEPEYVLDFIAYADYEVDVEELEELAAYVKSNMIDFIRGVKDIEDEETWNTYLEGMNSYHLDLGI